MNSKKFMQLLDTVSSTVRRHHNQPRSRHCALDAQTRIGARAGQYTTCQLQATRHFSINTVSSTVRKHHTNIVAANDYFFYIKNINTSSIKISI